MPRDDVALTEKETQVRGEDDRTRETMCSPVFLDKTPQRTPEQHEKDSLTRIYPPTGPAPTISPAHTVTSTKATYEVTVPKDPAKATSFYMIFGDGTYETKAIPQGSGTASFIFADHVFPPAGTGTGTDTGTYTQRATIVETGASAQATTATRCVASMPTCYLADFEPNGVPAGAITISSSACGQVLSSRNTTYALNTDIGPCSAYSEWGIKIVAGGITLDLNGHEILGCNSPGGIENNENSRLKATTNGCDHPVVGTDPSAGAYTLGEGTGIYLDDVEGVKVTNSKASWSPATGTDTPGTLTGYTSHVGFFDQGVVVTNRTAACPDLAVAAVVGPPAIPAHTKPNCNNTIEKLNLDKSIGTQASNNGEGIVIHESGGNTVQNNVLNHSGPYAGIGVYDDSVTECDTGGGNFTVGQCSRGNRIKNNTVLATNTTTYKDAFVATGIRIGSRASYTLIQDNTVDNSSLNGIALLHDSHHNIVAGNTVTDNGFHFGTSSQNRDARLSDPLHGDGSGDFDQNPGQILGDGIKVFSRSNDNTISGNTVCGNAGSGISVQAGAGGNAITDNESGGSWTQETEFNVGEDGSCGSRPVNLCRVDSGAAVRGGHGCSKNNVGKDPRHPEELQNLNTWPLAYDLSDRNFSCGTNTWSANRHGANSWHPASSDPTLGNQPEYDDRFFPPAPATCVA